MTPATAPHWPPIVMDEDGEYVWVRRDLEDAAAELVRPWGLIDAQDWTDPAGVRHHFRLELERLGDVVMVPTHNPEWDHDGWPSYLSVAHDDDEAQDGAVYVSFVIQEA